MVALNGLVVLAYFYLRIFNIQAPLDIIRKLELTGLSADVFAISLQRHFETVNTLRGLGPDKRRELKLLGLEGLGIRDESDLEQRVLASQLRELVDEWLNTGRSTDGRESPSTRNLFRTAKAIQAVRQCAGETPLRLLVDDHLSELAVAIGTEPASSGLPFSFYLSDSFERGLKEANRRFTGLMASDWKESVCKCRYEPCSRYFLLKKPRRSYAHGTFCCREHHSHASADALTRNLRTRGQRELIEAAARQLLKWGIRDRLWQRDDNRKRRLAEKLCEDVIPRMRSRGYRQEVKVNWVTWHRGQIERKRLELSKQ